MLIDERSLDVLDFARVREALAGQTHSPGAFARAQSLVPTEDFDEVRRLIAETGEMRTLRSGEGISIAQVDDVELSVATAARGVSIAASELRAIGNALAAANAAVRRIRESIGAPLLVERCAPFLALPRLSAAIADAIGERAEILDRASPALSRIRRGIASAQNEARDRATAIVRSAKYANAIQDQVVTVRDGRYVVPIKAEFSGEFPGIVHDASASGQTLFVEPLEALETNNRLRSLRMQEEHEVARILAELSAAVGADADTIAIDLAIYETLDLTLARAELAIRMHAIAPTLVDEATIAVSAGRHPLLGERAVPQSLTLDARTQIILISGPNMGGKTVALKMLGLFVTMAYCGLHLPAEEVTLGRFTRIFTDIGDEQSIALNASTFSAHLRRLAEIVAGADARSLILVDEIGSGTEPTAGAALAVAVLERFLTAGARTIATTHATELKLFGAEHERVQNASVRFDPDTYAPTYQLDLGSPGQSLAFALARTMNLDPAVVARAETLLSQAERDYDRALAELADERTRTVQAREALDRDRVHLRTLEDNARRRAEVLERERRELARAAETKLADTLRTFSAELERRSGGRGRGRVTSGQSDLLSRTIGDMHRDLGLDRIPAPDARDPNARAPIEIGDRVFVASLEQEGTVSAIDGDQAVVSIGSMRMTVGRDDLRRRAGPERKRPSVVSAAAPTLAAAANARTEIDVRGKRFVDAEPVVDAWIDEAMLLGFSPLRLIHGKGTGLLGRGLQSFLKDHPHVMGVRYGNEDEGGSGVTIFELR